MNDELKSVDGNFIIELSYRLSETSFVREIRAIRCLIEPLGEKNGRKRHLPHGRMALARLRPQIHPRRSPQRRAHSLRTRRADLRSREKQRPLQTLEGSAAQPEIPPDLQLAIPGALHFSRRPLRETRHAQMLRVKCTHAEH